MYTLIREKLSDSIRKFYYLKECPCEVSDIIEKGPTRRRIEITEEDSRKFHIDFQFKNDGTTSIDKNSGGQSEVKNEIEEFILADPECVVGDGSSDSKCYIANEIDHKDFEAIMELLCESDFHKSHKIKTTDTFEQYKFEGHYGDKLTVHYYLSTNKIMLQGRPLLLFTEAMSLVTELIESEEIPHFFNENYEITIQKSDVEQQFEYYFPNSYNKHPVKINRVLHQAVYNLQIKGDMFSYSYLVFPALKALEGHLKYLLNNYNIPLNQNKFSMFSKVQGGQQYNLRSKYFSNIGDLSKVGYLERAYNFYNIHRHTLFHWADPTQPIDDTRDLQNIGEVKKLITDTFNIIDEYYM